jgi:hypothetical protein
MNAWNDYREKYHWKGQVLLLIGALILNVMLVSSAKAWNVVVMHDDNLTSSLKGIDCCSYVSEIDSNKILLNFLQPYRLLVPSVLKGNICCFDKCADFWSEEKVDTFLRLRNASIEWANIMKIIKYLDAKAHELNLLQLNWDRG